MVLRRRRRGVVALVASGLLLAMAPRAAAQQEPEPLRLPLPRAEGEHSFADPTVLFGEGRYHAFGTNELLSPQRNIQVMSSDDLYRWDGLRDAMPDPPAWAWPVTDGGEFWAPTVTPFGDRYVLYFAAHHRFAPADRPGWCIGYAVADHVAGPYEAGSQPLLCTVDGEGPLAVATLFPDVGAGVIDPQVFVAPDGARYMHFKAINRPSQIYGIALAGTGLRTVGPPVAMLDVPEAPGAWEATGSFGAEEPLIENPAMDANPAGDALGAPFTLYYSGSDWRTNRYSTGVAGCASPLGPCLRGTTTAPWLATTDLVGGPGGLSLFTTESGERWAAYHGWGRGERASPGRRLHVEPFAYQGAYPALLHRPPTTELGVLTTPGQVLVAGLADDPDTGRPAAVRVSQSEDEVEPSELDADVNGRWSTTFVVEGGDHRFCARILDRPGEPGQVIGCVDIEVAPPGPETWGESLTWSPVNPPTWGEVTRGEAFPAPAVP